jgi:hypothetical protein
VQNSFISIEYFKFILGCLSYLSFFLDSFTCLNASDFIEAITQGLIPYMILLARIQRGEVVQGKIKVKRYPCRLFVKSIFVLSSRNSTSISI